jgi:uncharacterized glyoxalase superfamily protein PhnB
VILDEHAVFIGFYTFSRTTSYFGYLRVDDADGYYQDLLTKGVKINSPIENKPWGMREFGVESPEGHRVTIGQWVG